MMGFLSKQAKIGIIGSGAWGTALAQHCALRGHAVTLWGRDESALEDIRLNQRNSRYLPALTLHQDIHVTKDLEECVKQGDVVLIVTPAQSLPDILPALMHAGLDKKIAVLCAKGILIRTGELLSELFAPDARMAVLSGPTFAREVAMGLPTAATLACKDEILGGQLVQLIGGPMFRLYWNRDVIGAEAAGALKNVLAIACGVVDGLGLGDNARAALITRGMAEIGRYVRFKGGQGETLLGLCGLGDIVLTCASHQSRNYSFGVSLGQGQDPHLLLQSLTSVAEGVPTAQAVAQQIIAHNLDMPICLGVAAIVSGNASVHQVVDQLLQRPLRTDEEGQ